MNPHIETLKVCLLHMRLFQNCADNQVKDLRTDPTMSFRCQDRPALLTALTVALLFHEEMLNAIDDLVQDPPARMQKALDELEMCARLYQDLRTRRKLSASQRIPTDAQIKNAMQTLRTMGQTFTPEHYQCRHTFSKLRRRCRNALFERMRNAFEKYGPCPQEYPKGAVNHSIAVILANLGIEQGTATVIAERLRKRADRAVKHSSQK